MNRNKGDVESGLERKGFRKEDGDHNFFVYWTINGQKTKVRTKTSHGARRTTLGARLLSDMAKQCRLRNKQFLDLIDCDIEQVDYERLISSQLTQAPTPPSGDF